MPRTTGDYSMKTRRIILVVSGLWAVLMAGAFAQFEPVSPQALLDALPKKVPQWKVTESFGQTVYSEWIETVGTRTFERLPDPKKPDAAGARLTVSLVDTGLYPPSLSIFKDFSPGRSGNVEKVMVQSYPTVITMIESRGMLVEMQVAKRYILEFEFTGIETRDLLPWIKAVNIQALSRLPQKEMPKLPNPVPMLVIDELQPENNSSYDLHLTKGVEGEALSDEELGRTPKASSE